MNVFETVQEAFVWAFDEREELYNIKRHFYLNDEVEDISDVLSFLNQDELELYLMNNSYIVKKDKRYIYYHDELIVEEKSKKIET